MELAKAVQNEKNPTDRAPLRAHALEAALLLALLGVGGVALGVVRHFLEPNTCSSCSAK